MLKVHGFYYWRVPTVILNKEKYSQSGYLQPLYLYHPFAEMIPQLNSFYWNIISYEPNTKKCLCIWSLLNFLLNTFRYFIFLLLLQQESILLNVDKGNVRELVIQLCIYQLYSIVIKQKQNLKTKIQRVGLQYICLFVFCRNFKKVILLVSHGQVKWYWW